MKVDRELMASIASRLIKINSENPPGKEAEIASFVAERFAEIGLKTLVDKFGDRANVVGVHVEGEGPILLLLAHLDTVPAGPRENWSFPPFGGVVAEGRVYGRGAVDAKGPLSSMIGGIKALLESEPSIRGKLILAAVSDGEGDLEGIKRLLSKGIKADSAVIGEPTDLRICIAQKGRLLLSIIFTGKSSHAAFPDMGASALQASSKFVMELSKLSREFVERHHLLGMPSIVPTMINGGSGDSMVPDRVELLVDRRTLPSENLGEIIDSLSTFARRIGEKLGARTEVKVKRWIPSAEMRPDFTMAQNALRVLSEVGGVKAELSGFEGAGPMGLLKERGIPSLIFGPGDLARAHAPDEWISSMELEIAAKVYRGLASSLLRPKT